MALMNPTVNINGTSRESLVADRRAVADSLMEVMKALVNTKPHMRDYQPLAFTARQAYETDLGIWTERFAMLDKLRNEVLDEALAIQEGK
jgi:hypothetical protein